MDDSVSKPVRIMIWSVPRSVSTAFTKCLSFIKGMEVWLAPYHYSNQAKDLFMAENRDTERYPTEYEGAEEVFSKAAELLSGIVGCEVKPERIA